jgi:hypothetical protein
MRQFFIEIILCFISCAFGVCEPYDPDFIDSLTRDLNDTQGTGPRDSAFIDSLTKDLNDTQDTGR